MIPLLGLSAALLYGAADFLGGTAARRLGSLVATAWAGAAGLVVVSAITVPVVLAQGGQWSAEALRVGAVSAIAGTTSLLLLYGALARGPMAILSPLTAVLSAIVPVGWGVVNGEALGPLQVVGLLLALVAVVLVGIVPSPGRVRPTLAGLVLAAGAGIAIGVYLILLDSAPEGVGLQPIVGNRLVGTFALGVLALAAVLLARRRARVAGGGLPEGSREREGTRRAVVWAAAAGVSDVSANALILTGFAVGQLSIVSVLVALYPAGTILLAAVVHGERVCRVQAAGLLIALIAAVTLALPAPG